MARSAVVILLVVALGLLAAYAEAAHPLNFARPLWSRQEHNATATNQTAANNTIGHILATNGNFSVFHELTRNVSYFAFLNQTHGNYTVFAPTNEAFALLPPEFVSSLNHSTAGPLVVGLFSYGIINGTVLNSTDLPSGTTEFETLLGLPLNVTKAGDTISITGRSGSEVLAFVTVPDLKAENGVVHGIDHVLDPLRALRSTSTSATATSTGVVTITSGPSLPTTATGSIVSTITELPNTETGIVGTGTIVTGTVITGGGSTATAV